MAKYLRELTIEGTGMFPENKAGWKQFNGETSYIDEAFYAKLKRNVPSGIRKLIISIEPITAENESFDLAKADYYWDSDLDIFIVDVPFDLEQYLNSTDDQKSQIVYELLRTFLQSPFANRHFDVGFLLGILEELKDAGFAYVIENKKRAMNPGKTKGVRYHKVYTLNEMSVYALLSGKKAMPEDKLLIGTFDDYYSGLSADSKSSIAFIDENTIAYYEQRGGRGPMQLQFTKELE
ncbi:hypothetical protein ISG33_11235 [Glaciecola sp. MH2013]|uniref:hypothetical protein n=1 Tax=Glaciecola sp. MH2013 TaxID=2785524 RepID=UPI0018A0BAFA|nr:hypothetical protein [Glaciecola sp. MH2013]MBF7073973.1 hypothetical protein [Glaciecola sp. MH2013]